MKVGTGKQAVVEELPLVTDENGKTDGYKIIGYQEQYKQRNRTGYLTGMRKIRRYQDRKILHRYQTLLLVAPECIKLRPICTKTVDT